MSEYSKLLGSVVGAAFGFAVAKFGLPADLATPEVQAGVVTIFSAAFVYFFPANKPSA